MSDKNTERLTGTVVRIIDITSGATVGNRGLVQAPDGRRFLFRGVELRLGDEITFRPRLPKLGARSEHLSARSRAAKLKRLPEVADEIKKTNHVCLRSVRGRYTVRVPRSEVRVSPITKEYERDFRRHGPALRYTGRQR